MKKLIFILVCLFFVIPCQARIIYVDVNTPDNNDGSSWAKAYQYLQDALADANSSGDVNEIWVAQGTYTPDSNSATPDGTGDREATFQLINGVALKGGYAGFGATEPNERDIELYETILSGDLNGDDIDFTNNVENSYHVVTGSGTNTMTLLDGFTITAGNANGPWEEVHDCGGGMLNLDNGSPTVANCTFSSNSAQIYFQRGGGGMYNAGGSPTVTNCTFSGNSVTWSYDVSGGGGMYNAGGSPIITKCTFISNLAGSWVSSNCGGGGIYNSGGSAIISNCTFRENMSGSNGGHYGGGMMTVGGSTTVSNCEFSGNSGRQLGGGMFQNSGNATIINCIFSDNSGHGISFMNEGNWMLSNCIIIRNSSNGVSTRYWSTVTLNNCILWGNKAASVEMTLGASTITTVNYSNVQGGEAGVYVPDGAILNWGEGNVDADPCFADPNNNDYHLRSQAGRWDPNTQSWVQDNVTSPCIDTGNPNSSIEWEPYPNGGRINMGAYGGTTEASKSYFGTPPCEKPIAGDINGDCRVDFRDFGIMAFHWLEDNNP